MVNGSNTNTGISL